MSRPAVLMRLLWRSLFGRDPYWKARSRRTITGRIRMTIALLKFNAAQTAQPRKWNLQHSARKPQIVVSLTSIPSRIRHVDKTIKSILMQTVQPDRIVLWLSEQYRSERLPNLPRSALPRSLTRLERNGLEIRYTEDIGSYGKLVPALKAFPDDAVITIDDDHFYARNMVEQLCSAYAQHGARHTYCRTSRQIGRQHNGQLFHGEYLYTPQDGTLQHYGIGCTGILYPPRCMHPDILEKDAHLQLDAFPFADDFVFYSMAAVGGVTPVQVHSKENSDIPLSTEFADDLLELHGKEEGRVAKHHAIAQKVIKMYGHDPLDGPNTRGAAA